MLNTSRFFSRNKLDCGEAKDFVHRIHLKDERPFRLPYRRVSPADYHRLKQVLNDMEEKGIIRKSNSEWASPLVLVWKKSGDMRVCTDFRELNRRTFKDAYPLPHQSDALAALGGNSLFSSMDLTSGFYNVPLHESDKKYTACTTPVGLYEYNRMPQGLCNSPGSFMRIMSSIFGDQNYTSLLCYLDDLLVFAPSEEIALQRLEMVFSRLQNHGLKLSPKKCHFLQRQLKFLGHVVSEEGVSTDPDKVAVIANLTERDLMLEDGCTPSPKKVRSVLGMLNYYNHFIEGFSAKARPLYKLTAEQGSKGHSKRVRFKKLSPEDWTTECQQSFLSLKEALLQTVVLAHPDFDKPFVLSVDASSYGLGACLSQVADGEQRARPVAFASKSLNRAQTRYPAHRLEFLALKWAVCDKFSHWLRGRTFTIWTDNNPLTYILTKPKLDACEQRWVSRLAPYNFDLKYVPGVKNVIPDRLSRSPFVKASVTERLTREPYQALVDESESIQKKDVHDAFHLTVNTQALVTSAGSEQLAGMVTAEEVTAILDVHCQWGCTVQDRAVSLAANNQFVTLHSQQTIPAFSHNDLKRRQEEDSIVSRVMFYVQRKRRPSRRERCHEGVRVLRLLKQWRKLQIKDGILYRVSKDIVSGQKRYQFIVPSVLTSIVLKGVHDEAGHQGQFRTLQLARQRFFWAGLEQEVKDYVMKCRRCVLSKSPEPEARAPLESIQTFSPLELVCIDFWSAEDHRNSNVDVLVVTDHFTRLAHAFPCTNQTAKQVAKRLWNDYFCVYGFPQRIHSDRGSNFESQLVQELLDIAHVEKSRTTVYHPAGNGSVERFNRTLGAMIRALPPRTKHKWPQMINTLTFSYNCTTHETTGYAPFYLMFGRIPRLPVDVMFGNVLTDENVVDYDAYVSQLRRDLKEAVHVAQKNALREQGHQKRQFDKKVKGPAIAEGDRVLLANKTERGKKKLADKWASALYEVVRKDAKLPIYQIRRIGTGEEKTVHRNLIMQANFLPLDTDCEGDVDILSSGESSEGQRSYVSEVEMEDVETRTRNWVSQGAEQNESLETSLEEGLSMMAAEGSCENLSDGSDAESDDEEPIPEPVNQNPVEDEEPQRGNRVEEFCDSPERSPSLSDVNEGLSPVSVTAETANGQIVEIEPEQTVPRTRAGRIVKSVDRLICSMSMSVGSLFAQKNNSIVEIV